jgi:hypothetical protein
MEQILIKSGIDNFHQLSRSYIIIYVPSVVDEWFALLIRILGGSGLESRLRNRLYWRRFW